MKRHRIVLLLAVASCLAFLLVSFTSRRVGKDEWLRPIQRAESHLRDVIRRSDGPGEIYALLSEGTWGGVGQKYVFISNSRAVLHCDDENGRTRERDLTGAELDELRTWTSTNKVDRLPKFDEGTADGIQFEYFHAVRNGDEHRVFMNNPPGAPIGGAAVFFGGKGVSNRKLYGELTRRMLKLTDAPMRVIYPALEEMPGFRVVHAKENGEITAISYRNGQLLAGVSRSYDEPIEWHVIKDDRLSDQSGPRVPNSSEQDIPGYYNWHKADLTFPIGPLAGKRLWGGQRQNDQLEGLWISGENNQPELIAPGEFAGPVTSQGGEWIVVAKTPPGKMWNVPNGIVRIHLPDKRMFDVDLPPADNFDPVAWIEARKRVLVYRQRDWQDGKAGPEKPEFHLLDPVTGTHEKVEGEMRPFFDAGKHKLQPTARPNEFWAALHSSVVDPKLHSTSIGRFDSYNFRFMPMLSFRDVEFASDSVYVDEPSRVIWMTVNGDLLRFMFPN